MIILKYILWSALAFLCVFIYYSSKIKDKYNMNMIVGQIGSGKSCILCDLIRKHQKQGWHCYADFITNIPDCRYYNPKDLAWSNPEPDSVLFIDEGSLAFNNREWKNFSEFMDFFAKHRHAFTKIYFASQSFDVDLYIRNRCVNLYLVKRYGCISVMRKIRKLQTVLQAESLSNSQDVRNSGLIDGYKYAGIFDKGGIKFYWLPKLWKWHDSFYMTHKEPLPYTIPTIENPYPSFWKSIKSRFSIKGDRREALELENQEITSASDSSIETVYYIGAEGDTVSETRLESLDD